MGIIITMFKILLFSQTLDSRLIGSSSNEFIVEPVYSKRELIDKVVNEPEVTGLVIQQDPLDSELRSFLVSLKRNMPVLCVAIVLNDEDVDPLEGCRIIKDEVSPEEMKREIAGFLDSIDPTNRRNRHRFDWPLQGYLSLDQEEWKPYRVRSLSASGAFLECSTGFPPTGIEASLRVLFQNFKMTTGCEVMDPRQASSNLPPGFGVRFISLDKASSETLDSIIKNTLVKILTEEAVEPGVPTLDDDSSMAPSFEML